MISRKLKYIIAAILLYLTGSIAYASTYEKVERIGIVTYKSTQNVYVKFENTAGIAPGDTLFQKTERSIVPAVIVQFISTKSVAGQTIGDIDIKVDDKLYAVIEKEIPDSTTVSDKLPETAIVLSNQEVAAKDNFTRKKLNESGISGKFSIQSYSNISNSSYFADNPRWRYSFALNAKKIGGSNLSFSDYMTFAYRADQWVKLKENIGQSIRVYDLAMNYDFSQKTSLWLGR